VIEAEPEPVAVAAAEPPAVLAAEPVVETPIDEAPAPLAPPPGETLSVLEKLRASREQNRARVAAAIRSVSAN